MLAAVAIGAAALLYVKVDRLERNLLNPRAAPREGIREEDATGGSGAPEFRAEARNHPSADTAAGGPSRLATTGAGSMADAPSAPAASLEERITRLEEKARRPSHGMPMFSDRYARTVDDLAKQLSLTPTQRTRIEDAITRGKQRIDDILKIPDETGKSPYERRAEMRKKIEEAMKKPEPGGMLAFATDMMSHRDRKIPGRNETYSDEIKRVGKETRDEIATALDPSQRETFQGTNTDGLLGDGGQVSFAYTLGGGPAGESGEMIVEMGSTIETEDTGEPVPEDGK